MSLCCHACGRSVARPSKPARPTGMLQLTADMILADVARVYGIKVADLCGPRRDWLLTPGRFEAYWRLWKLGFSHRVVGTFFGNKDHTSVLSGIRRFEARLAWEPALRRRLGVKAKRRAKQ